MNLISAMAAVGINQASAIQRIDAAAHVALRNLPGGNQISCRCNTWRVPQQGRQAQIVQRQLIAMVTAQFKQPADADGVLVGAEVHLLDGRLKVC
jgi:hypothetical protein